MAALKPGKAPFEIKPMLVYVQRLVAMQALKTDDDLHPLLNPAKGSTAADHWALVAHVLMECGEYNDAVTCAQQALKLEPNHLVALKTWLEVAKESDEPQEVKQLKARLAALGPASAKKVATKKPGVAEEDVAQWYLATESTFFSRGWASEPRLERPFRAWVKKAHPAYLKAHPDDLAMVERLLVDEEGGGAMAGFLDSLTKGVRQLALDGVREDLVFSFGKHANSKKNQALLATVDGSSGR
jgi:tetratricopeptide (TPR) repeat protein